MSYLRTVVSFREEEYGFLKENAAKRRQSMAAVVREAVRDKMNQDKSARSPEEVERILAKTRKLAKENAKYLKGWDSLKALREIRREN